MWWSVALMNRVPGTVVVCGTVYLGYQMFTDCLELRKWRGDKQ